MSWITFSSFARLGFHGLVSAILWSLSSLYFYSNEKKRSPILNSLATLLLVISIFFAYVAIAGYTYHIDRRVYDEMIEYTFVPSIVVFVAAIRFRTESLKTNGHKHLYDIKRVKRSQENRR